MGISLDFSEVYESLFSTKSRYIDLFGGRGRGGSYTATQYYLHLITQPEYFRGYFMREIAGDIRESLWRDFKDRIEENDTIDENDFEFNETSMYAIYKPTGNTVMSKGFKKSSGNRTAKLKSLAGATHVAIEEAEEISKSDFRQLDDTLRTNKSDIRIIRIFNPPSKNHWIWGDYNLMPCDDPKGFYKALPKSSANICSIHSTYLDNLDNLNKSSLESWEKYLLDDPEYYWTMIKGLISEGVRGRIYKDFKFVASMPNEFQKFYGLDFGFNDPVALTELESHNQKIWADEKIYERGLTNNELSDRMKSIGIPQYARIYADSAEPKSIKELKTLGWNVIPAQKGPDSIIAGIKFIKQFEVFCTEKSVNLWREIENYHWKLNQNKEPTNDPDDSWNHLLDSLRYGCDDLKGNRNTPTIKMYS